MVGNVEVALSNVMLLSIDIRLAIPKFTSAED
jgi:hypothetical protein